MDVFKSHQERLQEAVRNNDTATAERILQECVALTNSGNIQSVRIECCETALKNRCLPMVKLLLSQEDIADFFNETCGSFKSYFKRMMWVAVESDFTEGVEFLQSKGGLLDKDYIDKCLENNRPEVFKYIPEHKILLLSEPSIKSKPTNNKKLKHVETHALHRCIRGSIFHREPDKVLDCVKLLVEAGADLNLEDSDGRTPIQLAAEHGMVTIVTYLVQHRTNLLHCLAGSKTKLESDSYDECIHLLMRRGVDINQLNSSNEFPLYIAVVNDNEGMVKSLITANCDVNMKVGDDLQPILLMSILRREETTIAEILIKTGLYINTPDKNGVTPLMECLKHGNVGLTKLLIENGANVNAQDNQGRCVLEYPCYFNTSCASDTVQMLINRGADIHKGGGILLNKAVRRGDNTTASLLIERGISVNKEDEQGDKPLGLAARNNDIKLVELLTQKGGDVNHQNQQGETALHKSADNDNGRKVTEILLQAGSDINLCDNYGRTALMVAALEYNRTVLQCLLEAGADVNKTDAVGNSAIHNLMVGSIFIDRPSRKWINCLKLLLTNKCHGSLDTQNENGETLLGWLLDKHEADLIWYLVTENCSLKGLSLCGFRDKFEFPDTLMVSKILFESGAPKHDIEALINTPSSGNSQSLDLYKEQLNEFRGFCNSRSLESRCRREIRKCIGSGIRSKITQLGLPQLLQDYIIMKDLIPEKYFTLVINDDDDDE